MSIHDERSKIKSFIDSPKGHNILTILIILGVSVASYGLGLMSTDKTSSEVTIKTDPSIAAAAASYFEPSNRTLPAQSPPTTPNSISSQGETMPFVASKRGKKYYPINCSAAKSLSEANKIYFKDMAEAHAKGYTLASGC